MEPPHRHHNTANRKSPTPRSKVGQKWLQVWLLCCSHLTGDVLTYALTSLNWRCLDLDNRLSVMYKITHDLVAIPRDQYLTALQRQSRTSHPMAYKQIATSTDYIKYSFFPPTIVHWNSLPPEVVSLPNVDDFNRAVCQINHVLP